MIPPLPEIRLEFIEDQSPDAPPGFLRLVRKRLRAVYADGTTSRPFVYDCIERAAIDAVVILAHYRDELGKVRVFLRTALRPPLIYRDRSRSPLPALDPTGSIWELPAGLVEASEQTLAGVRQTAARELMEELGFAADAARFADLGPSMFPAPAIIAERHFYFAIEVEPTLRKEPALDGSPLEHAGVVADVSLSEALAMCRDGRIVDSKTELGLRRLHDFHWGEHP